MGLLLSRFLEGLFRDLFFYHALSIIGLYAIRRKNNINGTLKYFDLPLDTL